MDRWTKLEMKKLCHQKNNTTKKSAKAMSNSFTTFVHVRFCSGAGSFNLPDGYFNPFHSKLLKLFVLSTTKVL